MEQASEDLLTIQDVVQILNVPRNTVDQWVKQGTLTAVRVGAIRRFYPGDIRRVFEEQTGSSQRKKRILVVDDDPLVGRSLRRLLERLGFDTAVASIGLAALDLVSREVFDLIITDIRMPGMSGLEALKAIRTLRREFGKPPVPEIVITAFDDETIREEADRMGIREFIVKPFEIDELVAALKRHLNLSEEDLLSSYAF